MTARGGAYRKSRDILTLGPASPKKKKVRSLDIQQGQNYGEKATTKSILRTPFPQHRPRERDRTRLKSGKNPKGRRKGKNDAEGMKKTSEMFAKQLPKRFQTRERGGTR